MSMALCGLRASAPVTVRGAQIFAGTQSLQPLTLIPTAELPDSYAKQTRYDIPAQTI